MFIGTIDQCSSGCPQIPSTIEALRAASREQSYMSTSSQDDSKSNQETQAFEPLLTQEEEAVPPALDDDAKERAEKSETAQVEEDKEKAEMVAKEAMLRVTGGQL